MTRDTLTLEDVWGIYAVPPLPRKSDGRRSLDLDAAEQVARHIADGGITRFLYGGNAFLYHISLDEYEALLDWLADFSAPRWPIPSLGPSFGRAIDQACLLRRHTFPAAMMLPCGDPRDADGCEAGMREIADAAGVPLIVYLKSEDGFGADLEQSLDAIGRLIDDGVAIAIKYAVVRDDPRKDAMLDGLLRRVDRRRVISGMGERPAIVHLRDFDARRHDHGFRLHRAAPVQRVPDGVRGPELDDGREPARRVHAARGRARRLGSRARPASRDRACGHRVCRADPAVRLAPRAQRSWPSSRPSRARLRERDA